MYSADSLDLLKEIDSHLGGQSKKLSSFISCRWLSVYDTNIDVQHILNV